LHLRVAVGQFMDLFSQIRRCCATDRLPDITSGQSPDRGGGSLNSLLQGAAGAVG